MIDPLINYFVYSAVLKYSVCWGRSDFSFSPLLALPTNYGKKFTLADSGVGF